MTMGPAPMIRMEAMSVRLGIQVSRERRRARTVARVGAADLVDLQVKRTV
jgi:hypothetical protein